MIATTRALEGREGRFAEPLSSLTDEWGEDRLRLLELDVSSPVTQVRRQAEVAIELWGRVDVLVNNAGTVGREFGPSEELGCVRSSMPTHAHTRTLSSRWQPFCRLSGVRLGCLELRRMSFIFKARGHGGSL